jgi:Protein of unknown function (DUF2855)
LERDVKSWAIDIDRADIAAATLVETELQIEPGQVMVSLDRFALTANNVTYAAYGKPSGLFGKNQGYWDFFSKPDGAGRLPVWGFSTVIESLVESITPGECFYGYYPMAGHAVLRPGHIAGDRFIDVAAARLTLPAVYNQYQRIDRLVDYLEIHHDYWPVFRPLYLTGWLLADQLADENDYGAAQVIVTSASSKTAIGFAQSMRQRDDALPKLLGVTSGGHAAALRASGFYDLVITYDSIEVLDPVVPSALVDLAGDATVTRRLHDHLGEALRRSIVVGNSHWQAPRDVTPMGGPTQEGFFAPTRIGKRAADWGEQGIKARVEQAWLGFMSIAPQVAQIDKRRGSEAALAAYREVLSGSADPRAGIIIEL